MEFKIDTRDTFTLITPANGPIDANLAVALWEKCEEMRQSGSKNFIVDMHHCDGLDKNAVDRLVALHARCYGLGESLVYTAIDSDGIRVLKENETDLLLNIAPTLQEAIDIVSMEILERDLFGEE